MKTLLRNLTLINIFIMATSISVFAQYNNAKYGIVGKQAPELSIEQWFDSEGETIDYSIDDFKGKVIYLLAFQSWCPGCHSVGFPNLKETMAAFKDRDDIAFLAVQTVFEGESVNTIEKVKETAKKYELNIPFGHDPGDDSYYIRSQIMTDYKTGGTPWVIIIDKEQKVRFNNFHLPVEDGIDAINTLLEEEF